MAKTNINFLKYKYFSYGLSSVIILAGIIFFFVLGGFNLGVDFTGGTIIHLKLEDGYLMDDVREVLEPFGLSDAALQRAGGAGDISGGSEVVIKVPSLDESTRNAIIDAFMERYGIKEADVLRMDNVGSVIGGELSREAVLSLIIATAGIIAYIAIRFEFRFALSGVVALLHDAVIMLAFFTIFQIEMSSSFIAAILSIVGYSLNNTIVIYDRIRENLKFKRKRSINDLVNDSLNETLNRTLYTSATTLFVLISLFLAFNYFIGGMDLKAFSLALLIGVISGAYSSLFIAGALWVSWRKKDAKEEKYVG